MASFEGIGLSLLAGSASFAIKYLRGGVQGTRAIITNIIIIVSVVVFIMPAIAEYYELSYAVNNVIVMFLVYFFDVLLGAIEKRVLKEIDKYGD